MARLRGPKSWMPKSDDPHKYLQMDLTPHRYIIVKIATQGDDTTAFYVKDYKIAYTDYNGNWIVHGKRNFSSYYETVSQKKYGISRRYEIRFLCENHFTRALRSLVKYFI
jgi:hypothetical protein